jgi:hypothetical protein
LDMLESNLNRKFRLRSIPAKLLRFCVGSHAQGRSTSLASGMNSLKADHRQD